MLNSTRSPVGVLTVGIVYHKCQFIIGAKGNVRELIEAKVNGVQASYELGAPLVRPRMIVAVTAGEKHCGFVVRCPLPGNRHPARAEYCESQLVSVISGPTARSRSGCSSLGLSTPTPGLSTTQATLAGSP